MIPAFDHNGVIPPYLGNPANGSNFMSPYPTNSMELCQRFGTSKERIEILKGFMAFREEMRKFKISGFQYLDGSFLEDIENSSEKRPPNDLDLLTFYMPLTKDQQFEILTNFMDFGDRTTCKTNYRLDHMQISLGIHPFHIVEFTRYFLQLFTHNRSNVWKGMLKLDVGTFGEDDEANSFLNSLS
jgi:hypothetical protein